MNLYDLLVAKKLSGGGGGGGGGSALEYEMGVITPPAYDKLLTIPFQNSHSTPPTLFAVVMADDTLADFNANQMCFYLDSSKLAGKPFPATPTSYNYGFYAGTGMRNSSTTLDSARFRFPQGEAGSNYEYPSYFCSNTQITARVPGSNVSWHNRKKYVWFALWVTVPTT